MQKIKCSGYHLNLEAFFLNIVKINAKRRWALTVWEKIFPINIFLYLKKKGIIDETWAKEKPLHR